MSSVKAERNKRFAKLKRCFEVHKIQNGAVKGKQFQKNSIIKSYLAKQLLQSTEIYIMICQSSKEMFTMTLP